MPKRWMLIALAAVVLGAGALYVVRPFDRDAAQSAGTAAAPRPEPPLRYDIEYPTIRYAATAPTDPVARLQAKLAAGEARLDFDAAGRGWLDSLLAELGIDPSSQVLVFSRTSLQSRRISPQRPRAIYFNDDVYVAWVQDGPIEIASMDPQLGVVYYLLEQQNSDPRPPAFARETSRCLSCHDSYSMSGGGVPRFIVGSGYVGPSGDLVSHEGWILVTDRTPFKSRWGGWYVTGQHGDQVHLGNMIIRTPEDFQRFEELRVNNIDTLDGLFDTQPYLTDKSDIVALLVLEHQADVQNAIVRASYDARTLLDADPASAGSDETLAALDAIVEPLLERLLMIDTIRYTAPVSGLPEFVRQFENRGIRDPQGRSLRDLDLNDRLFKYPLSYTIYSEAFNALPAAAKAALYRRLAAILRGVDGSETFASLAPAERSAVLEILTATKPDFARVAADSLGSE